MALHILLSELAQPEFKGNGMGLGPGPGPHGVGKKGANAEHNAKLLHRLSSLRGPLLGGLAQGQGLGAGRGKGAERVQTGTSGVGMRNSSRPSSAGGLPLPTTAATGNITHSSLASGAMSSAYAQEPFRNLTPQEPSSSSSSSSWHNEPAVADLDLSLSMISEGGEEDHRHHPQRPSQPKEANDRQPRPPVSSPPGDPP